MSIYHRVLADDILRMDNISERFDFLVNALRHAIGIDLSTYISNVIALDMLCLNPDRHFKNMGVIYNGCSYREAPIFDNGQALGANWNLCPLVWSVEQCVRNLHSCTFSGSFEMQFSAVRSTLKIDYDTLMPQLYGFEIKSRVIDILEYQLLRYKKIFS